nr:reverse transcriptase domain-containing protein [Tanacetum cinerariifolium]
MGIYRLHFTMRTCPPCFFESAQCSFDVDLHSYLERIVTASGSGFGDWKWRLATLPFAFGGIGVYSARIFAGDIYGDHVVSYVGIIGIKYCHNVVRDTLVDICYRYGISAGKKVDIGLDGGMANRYVHQICYFTHGIEDLMCEWI